MEKILKLQLDNTRTKPIFELSVTDYSITCLLDSGAGISVWCGTEELFHAIFPDAVKLTIEAKLSGFGGKGDYHDVYSIPKLKIEVGKEKLLISNFIIILAPNNEMYCNLIFGSCVFTNKIDYTVETRNKIHYLTLKYDKEEYIMYIKDSENELKNAYIAADDSDIN